MLSQYSSIYIPSIFDTFCYTVPSGCITIFTGHCPLLERHPYGGGLKGEEEGYHWPNLHPCHTCCRPAAHEGAAVSWLSPHTLSDMTMGSRRDTTPSPGDDHAKNVSTEDS